MNKIVKRWIIRIAISGCVISGTIAPLSSVSARDATPIAGAIVPDPALCTSEPRPVESVIALFANATPAAESEPRTSVVVPLGTRADATVANAVTAVIHEAFACLNAADFGRFLSLLTDKAVLTEFPWVGEALADEDFLAEFSSPTPLSADFQETLLAVSNIIRLEDGRSEAVVSYEDPNSGVEGTEVLILIFTLQEDRWLIDEAINLSPS